jgi:polysaccharide export outer membrane protein
MITHRGQTEAEVVELPQGAKDWSHSNVPVQPGDTVMVSKAGIAYVVGDVKKPGGFVMENSQMTVLQAIAMAEGTNSTAALNHAKLIHKTSTGQEERPIALNNIYTGKAPDLNMAPDDILFIPNSRAKSGFRRTMETILSTASGMAIYHPL